MGTWQAPQVTSDMKIEDLRNLVAVLIKDMDYLLNGYLDSKNLKVNGIEAKNLKAGSVIAEKIDVTELSAIAADLGTIIAGLLQAVSIIGSTITGSLIQTSESSYPRVELRSDDELFMAAASVDRAVRVVSAILGYPVLQFESEGAYSAISFQPSIYTALTVLRIVSSKGMQIESGNADIDFITGIHNTTFISWNQVFNRFTSSPIFSAISRIGP